MRLGEFDNLYKEKRELYERALRQVADCIDDIRKDFAADKLFRVSVIPQRIKSLDSLKVKAYEKSISISSEIFEKILDIAGLRIVVNNLCDIPRLIEKIKLSSKLHYDDSSYEDKIKVPLESGYRAIHFIVYTDVEFKGRTYKIPCEIQVHTLFQHSWSVLTHDDIYKGPRDLPTVIQKLPRRLADQLAGLDEIAQDIRDELSKEVEPPRVVGDDAPLIKESISFIVYELFNSKPPEYVLQSALNELSDIGLHTVGDLKHNLPDTKVIERLNMLHQRFFGNWPIDDIDKLIWGTKVKVVGNRAYAEFVDRVKDEWEEIERITRRESLSALPDTIDELIEDLQDTHSIDHGLWESLKELGALIECELCGEYILEPYKAYETICEHYGEDHPELTDLFYEICGDGGAECEDADHSGLCPHCAHLLYSEHT